MILNRLEKQKLIQAPKWLPTQTHYLTIMGSMAYSVSSDNSDMDYYGFCIPPREYVFPHEFGEIMGFGRQLKRFDQWTQHHIQDPSKEVVYDFSVYNIVKYFQLLMENNPNIIDSAFTPLRCVVHQSHIGVHVRENRKLFLHKGSWHKFKGYAYSQLNKIRTRENHHNTKRQADIEKHGYDTKYMYHLVRLLNQAEQILIEHDLDLERCREQLKSIRRGEWTLEHGIKWFEDKEKSLESLYASSTLQNKPDEDAIKNLLLECLEMGYGNVERAVTDEKKLIESMKLDIRKLYERYGA